MPARSQSCLVWKRLARSIAFLFYALAFCLTARGAPGTELDHARDNDPRIEPQAVVHTFAPSVKALWLEALSRSEADLKRQAAEAISRAHRLGIAGLADTAPRLIEQLQR